MMYVVVPVGLMAVVLSFGLGYLLCLRRVPDLLAAMTQEELSVLAGQVARRKQYEAPQPRADFVNINERVAEAMADVESQAVERVKADRLG